MVNAGPRWRYEHIARPPREAHAIDHGATAAVEDNIDGTSRLALGRCARAGVDAVHLAGKRTDCRASRERIDKLQADHRAAPRLVQCFERALSLRPRVAQEW